MGTATAVRRHPAPAAPGRRRRRRRAYAVVGASVGVLAVVIAIVAAGAASGTRWHPVPRQPAPTTLVEAVSAVAQQTLDEVGIGTAAGVPQRIDDAAFVAGGRPEVLYVGAEYCPYYAVERWALVQALARFGTFHGLKTSASAPNDVYPNTPTFSFYGATYTSAYLSFVGKELADNVPHGKHYGSLEQLSSAEAAVYVAHSRGTPFIDLGGRYVVNGATYDPRVLDGLTAERIATLLADPTTPVARGVLGAANGITAALCQLTGGRPTRVCATQAVAAYTREGLH
jgi:hypothetical protein